MSKIASSELIEISKAANDVILLLGDRHPDYGNAHGSNSAKMVEFWDFLNDKAAPPAVVKGMADDLLNCRKQSAILSHENDELAGTVVYWMKRAQDAEREIKKATCNHGYAPGSHTQGVVGCPECCGEMRFLWDYAPGGRYYDENLHGNRHEHSITLSGSVTSSPATMIGHVHEPLPSTKPNQGAE